MASDFKLTDTKDTAGRPGRYNQREYYMKRIKICSLDFLMYAYERRLEEDELMDEGYMDAYERLSEAEMRRSYAKC